MGLLEGVEVDVSEEEGVAEAGARLLDAGGEELKAGTGKLLAVGLTKGMLLADPLPLKRESGLTLGEDSLLKEADIPTSLGEALPLSKPDTGEYEGGLSLAEGPL